MELETDENVPDAALTNSAAESCALLSHPVVVLRSSLEHVWAIHIWRDDDNTEQDGTFKLVVGIPCHASTYSDSGNRHPECSGHKSRNCRVGKSSNVDMTLESQIAPRRRAD